MNLSREMADAYDDLCDSLDSISKLRGLSVRGKQRLRVAQLAAVRLAGFILGDTSLVARGRRRR